VLSPSEVVPALTDVSFSVAKGETFGVVGANGCGKSTLLKLVSGIFRPTSGRLDVHGKVSALIELGAGFHPEISGRENAVINGVMLGLTRHEIERKLPAIVEFSGLSEFIDQPVKTYSSGMYVRLGFAVAIHVDPDILVVDEVLAVGDEAFAHRCLDTIREMSARGKTIVFVTHALSLVEELCDRVLYLDHGREKLTGEPREVLAAYRLDVSAGEGVRLADLHAREQEEFRESPEGEAAVAEPPPAPDSARFPGGDAPSGSPAAADAGPPAAPSAGERPRRWGDRSAEITGCRLLDASGAERYSFRSGEALTVEIEVVPRTPLDDFVFGIGLFTTEDYCVLGTNTDVDGLVPRLLDAPATIRVSLPRCDLGAGTYLVDVAVHSRRETPYDYWRGACRFRVDSPVADVGVYRPERRWTSSGGVRWRTA
jgi:ABC-type polysaccharide/polyol phosphate transport system ATPase subunit